MSRWPCFWWAAAGVVCGAVFFVVVLVPLLAKLL